MVGVADVENLVMDDIARRGKRAGHRLTDILHMHQRPPRRSIAGHLDLFGRPGQTGQVVQHNIEAHPRRRTIRGRVAQKGGREGIVGQLRHIPLDQHFTLGVRGLRIGLRLLSHVGIRADTIHTARRCVHEAADAYMLALFRQLNTATVVDGVG